MQGGGGCCWADQEKQEPVKDWVATATEDGYCVHACPEFVRSTYGFGRYRTAEDYILVLENKVQDQEFAILHQREIVRKARAALLKANKLNKALKKRISLTLEEFPQAKRAFRKTLKEVKNDE